MSASNTVTKNDLKAILEELPIGQQPVDFIVEQGTSGYFTYRKWNSGISECWTTTVQRDSAAAPTGQEGSVYWRASGTVPFPSGLFVSTPTCFVYVGNGESNLVWSSMRLLTKDNVAFYYVYDVNATFQPYWNIEAKGRWK